MKENTYRGMPTLSRSEKKVLAVLAHRSTVIGVSAEVVDNSLDDFLFRLVTYTSGNLLFLGIIEDVQIRTQYLPPADTKALSIRNLLCLDAQKQTGPVRDAPSIGTKVSFASNDDLHSFFPKKEFHGYLGYLRGTNFPLPLDLNKLCFANTAILAGINHGKSHLAALLVSQLHLAKKRVLVIDPSGEWTTLANKFKEMIENSTNEKLSVRSYVLEELKRANSYHAVPWEQGDKIIDTFHNNDLTILDISLTGKSMGAEGKASLRCEAVYDIQQALMRHAAWKYGKTREPYGLQGCVVLDEAHEFVPHMPTSDVQKRVSALFSISTKEYRKYGLGHIFIDQSLKAISEDLQIQTFLLGATTTPTDIGFLESSLGSEVASAAQRTIGGVEKPSWVAYGVATPVNGIPWEIETLGPKDISLLLKKQST